MVPNSPHFKLRLMREDDLSLVLSWRNSERIRAASYHRHLISEEEHHEWFRRLQSDPLKRSFIFELNEKAVGVVNFYFSSDRTQGTWGFYLGEENLPKGIGTEMGKLAMDFAFKEMELKKVKAEALLSNARSIQFHQKLGFKAEGEFEKEIEEGRKEAVVAFGLEKDEWFSVRQNLQ